MGLFGSKEDMAQEREPTPDLSDEYQTTSEPDDERFKYSDEDSSDGPPELRNNLSRHIRESESSEDGTNVDILLEFQQQAEVFFAKAEAAIDRHGFGLEFAKDLVLRLRDVGYRYGRQGCEERVLEDLVVSRALRTVAVLVDGVQQNEEEVLDPRQTLVFVYCAMAVFPNTVQLEERDEGVGYRLSLAGSACLPTLDTLQDYCCLKTAWEHQSGLTNMTVHHRLLLDLAAWLEKEGDRAFISFLITARSNMLIRAMLVKLPFVGEMRGTRERFEKLWDMGVVLEASVLVGQGWVRRAKLYHRLLTKVNPDRLPPKLATRYNYVYACLLHSCGEFDKALDYASAALRGDAAPEEQRALEDLIDGLEKTLKNRPSAHSDHRAPPDPEWLEDTHAASTQSRTEVQDAAREKHISRKMAKSQRKKRKSVSYSKKGDAPPPSASPSPSLSNSGVSPDLFRNGRKEVGPSAQSSTTPLSTRSTFPASFGSYSREQANSSASVASSRESLLFSVDWDDSEEDEEDEDAATEREIRFYDSSDEDIDDPVSFMEGNEEEEMGDWFEKSQQALAEGQEVEDEEEVVLSDRQTSNFERGSKGRAFYPDWLPNAEEHLKVDPRRFKRCQLKIERAHLAVAKVLDKDSKISDIRIEGRSKAGRTYMDDEVVVEIFPEQDRSAAQADAPRDNRVYGKVVGLLKRVNFNNIEHPVLYCTLDETEGHLMKPLCKTVPKIHVLNDTVRKKYPMLVKNRIEIKTFTEDGDVQFQGFRDVRPEQREQFVFKVVLLAWRQCSIYPLGAVLAAHMGGRDYAGGLQVLRLQQRVPKFYSRSAVEHTKNVMEASCASLMGRDDLTAECLFTIDPPGSEDLDDAISVRKEGQHVVVGVHIADVAAVVERDSGVDQEAKRRAVTFYPLQRRPHCMLPEPLSHGKCSLLPGQQRLAFSVFFTFDQEGKQVDDPKIRRTVIRSSQQLTYKDAQRVIEGEMEEDVDPAIQEDIRHIHQITSKLRKKRLKDSVFFIPFEDPRLPDMEEVNDAPDAHALIEELMILTNHHVAHYLKQRPLYRDSLIVRSHKTPSFEELAQWRDKEGQVTDLVMQLQGKQVTPQRQLSVLNPSPARGPYSRPDVIVQRQVWERLCRHLEEGEVEEARKLAFTDALHPLQWLASSSWMELMESAQYRCAYGLNGPDLVHFGLSLPVYTHFTSPIRRYADLHVQRVLHAALDGKAPGCSADEVTALCHRINSATSRQKAFSKGCLSLRLAEQLQRQPLVFRSFVDRVDDEQLTVMVPSLHRVQDRQQQVPFSVLGVSSQPELTTDTARKVDQVKVQWSRKFYDNRGTCPGSLGLVRNHLESRSPNSAVVMTLSPDLLSVAVKQQDWTRVVRTLLSDDHQSWDRVPQPRSRGQLEVEFMSSEKRDGTVSQRPIHFHRTYTRGQILQLQMSSEPNRGLLKPRIELVHLARNVCTCTLHVSAPVLTLTRPATRSTRDQQFPSYLEYIKAWMPLLEMEAAMGAGEGESAVVIDNVKVTLKAQDSKSVPFTGCFTIKASFCYTRGIEFGGKSGASSSRDECDRDAFSLDGERDVSFPQDYLCLRYQTACDSVTVSRGRESGLGDAVDRQFTWLSHATVVDVLHKGEKRDDGGELRVTFALCPSSPLPPPPQLLKKEGASVTVELLPKAEVDRRAQEILLKLQDPKRKLARAIAFGKKLPKLDEDHLVLGEKDQYHEVYKCPKLPKNNMAQLEAIRKALTRSVSVIQGPPGSGKTNTGIKLVYQFCQINRQLQADGKGQKTVLYCGPSNKSVDLVARELKLKLGPENCPKMVRAYGSAIEAKDYPGPFADIKPLRGMRDLRCDPELQDMALHHLIRQDGKPYAEEIAEFDKHFDQCRQQPHMHSVTVQQMKKYRRLLFKASTEELRHYEVVLATCAVGGNSKVVEGVKGTMFQLIIDECAMCPEPHSMAPLMGTEAQQVVLIGDHKQLRPILRCQAAADLGLDKSLFERLFQRYPEHTTFLNIQYRMHPEICAFPSSEFYDGVLTTGYSALWGGEVLPIWPSYHDQPVPHLLVNVCGQEEMLTVNTDQGNERSKSNALEADKVIEIVTFLKRMFRELKAERQGIKVLTQYNAQRHLLEGKLREAIEGNKEVFDRYDKTKITVSTVVSSQGGEWDYVIVSTVRSLPSYLIEANPTHGWCRQNMGFITDRNQVNVALTRARRGLFIVGNAELLRCDEVWRHLVERYEKRGCCVHDPALFPPPPTPAPRRARHTQRKATDHWQQVT